MDYKTLNFTTCICGKQKILSFEIPMQEENVVTNRFCPQELLTGKFPNKQGLITTITGETFDEFVYDCNMQIIAMRSSTPDDTKMDAHIGSLMAAVTNHLKRYGRLIFGDLLIYVDCFSYLLWADGFSEEEIKRTYPRITKIIVDFYPDFVKNSVNLAPLKETPIYYILNDLVKEE